MKYILTLMIMIILAFGDDYESELKRLNNQYELLNFLSKIEDVAFEVALFCINLALTENSNLSDCKKLEDEKRAYAEKEYKAFSKITEIRAEDALKYLTMDYDRYVKIFTEMLGECTYDVFEDVYKKDKLERCEYLVIKEYKGISDREKWKINFDREYLKKYKRVM